MAVPRLLEGGVLALLASYVLAIPTGRIHIDASTGHFTAEDGRVRVFHGVNVVHKEFPWHPSFGEFDANTSLNAGDIANLSSWGFNVVRLGVMWPGVEPSPGVYNETYLKVMRQLVDNMHAQGIYTIVDFHQDAFMQKYCGEGVPDWMTPMLEPLMTSCSGAFPQFAHALGQCKSFAELNYTIDPSTGFPRTSDCLSLRFDQYSRAPELVSAWGNFYASPWVQSKFHQFWRVVATAFVGAPGVLGYDLVNEPLNGNFFENVELLVPGFADKTLLQPMYQSLHTVIRSVDPDAIIMYEPTPFPDTYPANVPFEHGVHPVGFTSGPAQGDVAHQALSYHHYSCGFADPSCDRKGDTKSSDCPACDKMATAAVNTRQSDAARLGGGVILTEFGACSGSPQCVAEINRITNNADSVLHSWAYWQFKYDHDITTCSGPIEGFYKGDGSLQTAKVAALSRTYAPMVSGRNLQMRYDPLSFAFRLRYDSVKGAQLLPSVVFINEKMNYHGTGFEMQALNATIHRADVNHLHVMVPPESRDGLAVDVAIAKPYAGKKSGAFLGADSLIIHWDISDDKDAPGFELSSFRTITGWKSLRVVTDDGRSLCEMQTQDSYHGPAGCTLVGGQTHDLLFEYRIEVWKANFFGVQTHVDTIPASLFGPLLGKRIKFLWLRDSAPGEALDSSIVV